MRRIALAIAAVGALSAVPAQAMPLDGAGIEARAAGAEFRATLRGRVGIDEIVWRFAADGTATARLSEERGSMREDYTVVTTDSGRWTVTGGRLCLDWAASGRACYAVEALGGSRVRLSGGARVLEGTLAR